MDLRNELEELKQEVDSGEVFEGSVVGPSPRKKWSLLAGFVAVAVAAVLGTYLLMRPSHDTVEKRPTPLGGTLAQLTTDAGQELFPSLSPDGKFVVYESASAGNLDIYTLRVGGTRPINLTEDSEAADTQPSFSPDGELIVFQSERDGGGLFVMGATGESVKRLTDFGYNPAWSPDGEHIVFSTISVSSGTRYAGSGRPTPNHQHRHRGKTRR